MYSNNLTSLRHWSRLSCICRYSTALEGQKVPQVTKSIDGISPPPRINRGCTDILQALAATVKPDPTGAHYKYHDDPYLIPLSNYRKRAYALSAEAGRKAAAWIRDEHAELFTEREWDPPTKKKTPHFNADPHIDAFLPRPIYNDESKVTEKDLKYTIENALLEDSIKVYQLLGGKEGVSDEMKISFLQFLCFCNEKEPDSLEWLEERWFAANTRERISTKWKLGGLADNIFESIEQKTPEAYCAIIQGMAKYYQAERAYVMTQEAIENGIQLSTGVFNALLGCVGFMKEGVNQRIQMMNTIMTQMNQQGLSPNVETLTSCLRSVSAWGGGQQLQQLALGLVAELRRLGVEPGLSAYYYLLCLFCKERGPRVDILTSILKDLESRETLEAKEATETHFFLTAMGVCSDHLQDLNLAERIHALLMKGDNYKLVGDAYKESIYYRHFVTITCRQAPLEKTLNLLDTLIPNVYVPEPTVMEEIIKTLELGGAGARLAQAWSQLVVFGHAKRTRLVQRLLAAMVACYRYQDDEIKAKMRESAVDILKSNQMTQEREETMEFRSPPPKLSATALCHIIEMCADGEHAAWESVSAAAGQLRRGEAAGVPAEPRPLLDAATAAAAAGHPSIAASIMSYLSECGFEEAASGGELVLGALLNRPAAEARELLQRPRAEVAAALHPAALAVFDAYHTAKSGGSMMEEDTSSASSESDGMTSSDEEM